MAYYRLINSLCSDLVSWKPNLTLNESRENSYPILADSFTIEFHSSLYSSGDIVVPGAFIALLLRYDVTRKKGSSRYFTVSFIAYIIALFVTVLVLQVFKHAQPALLYIVPLCLVFPLVTALICRDWSTMFAYEDHASEKKNE